MYAAIYLSRPIRLDGQSVSIKKQIVMLQEFAELAEMPVGDIFIETAFTNPSPEDGEMAKLLAAIERGDVTELLTTSVKQFGRNYEVIFALDNYLKRGVLEFIQTPYMEMYRLPPEIKDIAVRESLKLAQKHKAVLELSLRKQAANNAALP